MPVKFPAVVRIDNALTFADEIDEFARCAEFVILRAIERAPYEWDRNAPGKERIGFAIGGPYFARVGFLSARGP